MSDRGGPAPRKEKVPLSLHVCDAPVPLISQQGFSYRSSSIPLLATPTSSRESAPSAQRPNAAPPFSSSASAMSPLGRGAASMPTLPSAQLLQYSPLFRTRGSSSDYFGSPRQTPTLTGAVAFGPSRDEEMSELLDAGGSEDSLYPMPLPPPSSTRDMWRLALAFFCLSNGLLAFLFAWMMESHYTSFAVAAVHRKWDLSERARVVRRAGCFYFVLAALLLLNGVRRIIWRVVGGVGGFGGHCGGSLFLWLRRRCSGFRFLRQWLGPRKLREPAEAAVLTRSPRALSSREVSIRPPCSVAESTRLLSVGSSQLAPRIRKRSST